MGLQLEFPSHCAPYYIDMYPQGHTDQPPHIIYALSTYYPIPPTYVSHQMPLLLPVNIPSQPHLLDMSSRSIPKVQVYNSAGPLLSSQHYANADKDAVYRAIDHNPHSQAQSLRIPSSRIDSPLIAYYLVPPCPKLSYSGKLSLFHSDSVVWVDTHVQTPRVNRPVDPYSNMPQEK